MGERITVVGGTDSTIAVTLDGSHALSLAKQFKAELDSYYQDSKLNFLNVEASPNIISGDQNYGRITSGGTYTAGNGYDYIVVGSNIANDPSKAMTDAQIAAADLLNAGVTIRSAMSDSSNYVKIIAGNQQGFSYYAAQESGSLAAGNVNSNVYFEGNTVNGGNWDIGGGQGNDTIITGSGNNTVDASLGNNLINITSGVRNSVNSLGNDTISATSLSSAINSVTLRGGTSTDYHATVNINAGSNVQDISYYNVVTVGGGSTITGGTYGSYTFDGSYDSNLNILNNGYESTITATGALKAIHGDSNIVTASNGFTLINGYGNYSATVGSGVAEGYGAEGLNYTLNAAGNDSGLFVADTGNETLNASGSTAGLQIFANTVVGGTSNFVATGGSGNDVMMGGTGNATFTGGAGNNLFEFIKGQSDNGNTVITDFAREGSNNTIAFFNYGLDTESLTALLASSSNDANGNAVLKIAGQTITIQGVSIDNLTVNNFMVGGGTTNS